MFVQVISGPVADAAALRRQIERWMAELRPGAEGWLGTTAGVTADGQAIVFARFASREAARANSERPEQGQWWAETEKCFAGPPRFEESTDVEEWMGGGNDAAGFVQFMRTTVRDRDRLGHLDRRFADVAASLRPDLLGGLRVWTGPDTYVEAAYFTTEADARAGESQEAPPELQELMDQWSAAVGDIEYLDVPDPWLHSP